MPNPTAEQLEAALTQITWPDCDGRRGVMPDGVSSVSAFAMGLIGSRVTGKPMCSNNVSAWPRLAQLATSFVNCHADKRFAYTSIQFNKGYAAALHGSSQNGVAS